MLPATSSGTKHVHLQEDGLMYTQGKPWAAQHNTWLLIGLTLKGVSFSVLHGENQRGSSMQENNITFIGILPGSAG